MARQSVRGEVMPQRVEELIPRVRHLEQSIASLVDNDKAIFGKLDQISVAIAGLQAGRPALGAMDAVRTGLSILQTLVLLIGAGVGSIVYVSSNANNSAMAVQQERMTTTLQRLDRLEEAQGWSPRSVVRAK